MRRADHGRLQAVLDEPLADPLDRGGAHLDGLGDLTVGQGGSALGGIGLEEDAGVGQLLGGGLAGGDEVGEGLTFLGGQRDDVLLQVGSPGAVIAKGGRISPQSSSRQWRTNRLRPGRGTRRVETCLASLAHRP